MVITFYSDFSCNRGRSGGRVVVPMSTERKNKLKSYKKHGGPHTAALAVPQKTASV